MPMQEQAAAKQPLWKSVLLTIFIFILANFIFEMLVELMSVDIYDYYPFTRVVILLLTIGGIKIYRSHSPRNAR